MRRFLRSVVGLSTTGCGILPEEVESAREEEEERARERRGESGGTKGLGTYGFVGPVELLRGFAGSPEERKIVSLEDLTGGEEGRDEGSTDAEKVMEEVRLLFFCFGGKGGGTSGSVGCLTSFNLRLEEDLKGLYDVLLGCFLDFMA